MKNKKGFTLIELLAVIIILGILMIIAIPAVTSYIQDTKHSAFVDTAVAFMDDVRNKVNSGVKINAADSTTLFLIPAGHEEGKSCVALESGGESPFTDTWDYAYVGVTYNTDGSGYKYYFVGQDTGGNNLAFNDYKTIRKKTHVETNSNKPNYETTLKTAYAQGNNKTYTETEVQGTSEAWGNLGSIIPDGTPINKIVVIGATNCTNK